MNYLFLGSDKLFEKLSDEIGLPKIAVTNEIGLPKIAVTKKSTLSQKSNIEIFDHKECKNLNYNIENWSSVPPLSKELLLEYAEFEHIYLKMADRLGFIQSYQQRKDEYNKHLRFWIWKLSQFNFELAIFENVPHEGYNYVLYSILIAKKIKVITFFQLPIRPGKTYLLQAVFDIFNHGAQIKELSLNNNSSVENLSSEILKKFEGYLELSKLNADKIKSFTRNKKKLHKLHPNNILQILFKFVKLRKTYIQDLKKNFAMKMGYDNYLASNSKLLKYYKKNEERPSLKKRYIYFTMHYQPELSTSPLGGVFVDQILACEILAFAAKKMNIYLYVKEHPRGSKAAYTKAYDSYERLLNYDNVKFLSNDLNTYELVDNSICVSTITGSSGWEALLRKKPVLMFGTRFYEACYGAFSVSSVEDVEEALSKILSGKIQITNEKINSFLCALDHYTFEGFTSKLDERIATVSMRQSIINKVNMIKNLIN